MYSQGRTYGAEHTVPCAGAPLPCLQGRTCTRTGTKAPGPGRGKSKVKAQGEVAGGAAGRVRHEDTSEHREMRLGGLTDGHSALEGLGHTQGPVNGKQVRVVIDGVPPPHAHCLPWVCHQGGPGHSGTLCVLPKGVHRRWGQVPVEFLQASSSPRERERLRGRSYRTCLALMMMTG